MPPIPARVSFSLLKVESISRPHPYCITPRHVEWAADHYSGMLTQEAIIDAEKNGAKCDICRKQGNKQGNILTFAQHETVTALFIQVPAGVENLNDLKGLHKYLFENKAKFESLGIQGFAFSPK